MTHLSHHIYKHDLDFLFPGLHSFSHFYRVFWFIITDLLVSKSGIFLLIRHIDPFARTVFSIEIFVNQVKILIEAVTI